VSARVERSVLRLSIPLKDPFVTSSGVVSARELLLLRLEARDGTVGYGEAAPFEPYDGVPLERAAAALTGGGGRRPPQARAAEEIARLDLHARQEERPLAEPRKDALAVNMTLAAGPPEEVAERARAGLRDGYACFKLKVGLPDDVERVAAVREAVGPWPALRVDANGAWSVDDAVRAIRAIEDHDLEFVEQPCRTLRELSEVRQRVSSPIAADESVGSLRELRRAVELEACDVVNVKVAGTGGFRPARELLREARAAGLDAFLSSTLDGPWGIAAALQLAAAEELPLACGLATLELFDSPLARALPSPRAGTLSVPHGPGLGVDIEEEDLAAVTAGRLDPRTRR
jgi:L-Ala-D/L-Glu epimerase / N-acetyl-D-glutamate racemase